MADIFLNTNTVLGETYDQYGNAMGDYNPVFPYKSSFRLRWQLYTATPGADSDGVDMSAWTKADYTGCGALVTCDNDFVHRLSGTLATGITSGSTISSITVNIGSNRDLVPASGFVTIFNNAGGVKDLAYTAVEISGNNAELTIGEWTADADYSSGAVARFSQEAYFQSYYNVSLSNPATGLFVFDCVVYSRKVSAAGDAASGQWIDVQGIEILPYKLADNVYTELPSYLCRTAAISVNMGEAGTNPEVTPPVENMILAFVSSLFSEGANVELYNSSTGQWVPYAEVSEITSVYTKYRWWLNGGDGSVKTELPIINGANGTTPHIGANGDWYIGDTDTEVPATGDDGTTPHIDANTNHWMIGADDTGVPATGADGVSPYIGANGHWYDANGDTGVQAAINGSYIEFSAVDSSGNYTLAGTTTVPYAVLTNAGNFYPVEKGSVTVNTTLNTVTVNVAPYLAYDNAQSFSGTWRLYFAAGSIDAGDEIVSLTGTAITPQDGAVFKKTLAAPDAFTIDTSGLTGTKKLSFELWIIQPSTAVTFTLPNTLLWPDLDYFDSGNPPPAMSDDNTLYCIVIRWDGSNLLANLAYSKAVTA